MTASVKCTTGLFICYACFCHSFIHYLTILYSLQGDELATWPCPRPSDGEGKQARAPRRRRSFPSCTRSQVWKVWTEGTLQDHLYQVSYSKLTSCLVLCSIYNALPSKNGFSQNHYSYKGYHAVLMRPERPKRHSLNWRLQLSSSTCITHM